MSALSSPPGPPTPPNASPAPPFSVSLSPVPPSSSSTAKPQPSPPRIRSADAPRTFFKRKVALYIAYDGSAYAGLQKNDGVSTVAGALEDALFAAGHIQACNYGDMRKLFWVAAARTDKGVSAASNVVAMKLTFPRNPAADDGGDADTAIDYAATASAVNAHLPRGVRVLGVARPTASFSAKNACSGREYEYLLPLAALTPSASLPAFAEILNSFQGTHSFHNYTIGAEHSLPPPARASRYITLATCAPQPVVFPGASFVRIRISGQSFQLHQIRKMVAAAVLVERCILPADSIERSFDKSVLANIPPAPAEGLFLNTLHFTAYNDRFEDKLEKPIELESFEEEREAFKDEFVYPSIVRRFEECDGLAIFFRTVEGHKPVIK